MDVESGTVATAKQAEQYRQGSTNFAHRAAGYGVITHSDETQMRVHDLPTRLHQAGAVAEMDSVFDILAAADRIASAAMWLVVHMTYARNVYLDGRA